MKEIVTFDSKSIPNHVAIEGNVGAGKSTVASLFSYMYGYPHIGEYGNYVDFPGGERFPIFPPQDNLSVVTSNPLWINLEFRRQKHMLDTTKYNKKNILLVERSPLSLVAFEYAKMKQGLPYETTNLLGNYAMFLATGQIKEPLGYVFLNTSPETVEKRIIERGGRSINFLFLPQTCIQIEHFFEFFKRNYLTGDRYQDIQTDKLSPEVIATQIKLFIECGESDNQIHPFANFCRDILSESITFEKI